MQPDDLVSVRHAQFSISIQYTHLVVLDCEVTSLLPLLVRDLHEESTSQSLPDIVPVVLILPSGTAQLEIKPLHTSLQLCSDVVRLGKGSSVEEVLPAPVLCVALVGFVGVVDVQKGKMIAVGMGKLSFCDVGLFLGGSGAHEHVRN